MTSTGEPTPRDWVGTAAVPLDPDTVYNGFVAANVVYALDQLGVFDQLDGGGTLDLPGFLEAAGHDPVRGTELVRVARMFGYVAGPPSAVRLTAAGLEMAGMRGYFTWGVGGYSGVFANAAPLTTRAARFGTEVTRSEAMVGRGSGQNDQSFLAGLLDDALANVDFQTVADLGSGVCVRLCRVLAERPDARGYGIDISAPATVLADDEIGRAGMVGRVNAVEADVLRVLFDDAPADHPAFVDADMVMSFFLMHDLLADASRRKEVLPRMREAFPKARTFVLADTMLRPEGGDHLPIFSAGYELAHALMGVPLHTTSTYEELFADAGLKIRRTTPFGTPHSWLYVLDAD